MHKRQFLSLALAATAAASFTATAGALPTPPTPLPSPLTIRDFGPVGASPAETVRLVVQRAPLGAVPVGLAAAMLCRGQFFVSSDNAPPQSAPFNLAPGQTQTFDIDPAQIGLSPPVPGKAALWELSAAVVLDGAAAMPGPFTGKGLPCAKAVTASVQILDRATGEIRRVDDVYTETVN